MEIGKLAKKAMIDLDISGAIELSEITGLSKDKCYRLLNSDETLRLVDVRNAFDCLGYKLKAEKK